MGWVTTPPNAIGQGGSRCEGERGLRESEQRERPGGGSGVWERAGAPSSALRALATSRVMLVSLALATLAALWCTSAFPLLSRGHVFRAAFGAPGAGDGELSEPSAVAVDEASGLVYVSDTGNDRVEVFKRGGGGEYEYLSQFKVRDAGPIAVDNSTSASDPTPGEVYVAGAGSAEEAEEGERNALFVYSPAKGEVIRKVHTFKFKEKGEEEEEEFEESISGLSVDATGMLWVYWEEEGVIDAFEKQLNGAGNSKLQWIPSLRRSMEERFECWARPEAFYVGYERRNSDEECPGESEEAPDPTVVAKLGEDAPYPQTLIAEIDHRNTTGAAIDPANGDLYLDNVSSVAAYTPEGVLIQRFGIGQLSSASGVAVDSAAGEVLAADRGEDRVVVFGPEATPGPPAIESVSSENLTPRSAELRAQIDPHGAETEYHFQYGTSDCATDASACTDLPAGKIVSGYGDVTVSAQVHGLEPATAYYYRVLASNAQGQAQGLPSPSTFQTLPSPAVLPDGRGWELVSPPQKHGSTIEMVSQLRGGSIQASLNGSRLAWLAAGPVVSEPEGNRSFELSQLMSVRAAEGWETTSLETPHTKGWGLLLPSPGEYHFFTSDLSASLVAPTEFELGKTEQTEGIVEHPPLSPLATEKTMYLRGDLPSSPAVYTPLVTAQNDTASTKFGGSLDFLGATSDLAHVVFHSKSGLTAAAPTAAGLYLWQQGKPLELVSVFPDGTPAPDGGFSESALGDGGGLNARSAISEDGSRVFWTDGTGTGLYLRDAVHGKTIRLNSAQGHGAIEAGPAGQEVPEVPEEQYEREVHFQSASADGTKVLFTDTARLTEDSAQEPTGEESPADLYEFELTSEEPLRGRLRDLTAGASSSSGDVLNLIPGSSRDGSKVYFVANATLAPGAVPGRCSRNPEGEPSPPGATCNLYLSEEDPAHPGQRRTRFIALLTSEDGSDWGANPTSNLTPLQSNLSVLTSSVSPDGRYLAFTSERSLTGYDNRDALSGQPDEEVFLYDAASERLLCASCNSGSEGEGWQRPHGIFDTEFSGEGIGLLVDRPQILSERWLAGSIPGWTYNINGNAAPAALYQPRYLSDSGRLFFNSADALVHQDSNGKEDVYQYEPQGVGSCHDSGGCTGLISSGTSQRESAFLDASQNGEDVFFLTSAPLVAADTDQAIDIYDAHVCSSSSPCFQYPSASTPECESAGECRPSSSTPPVAGAPASATFSGPGNPAATPQQTVAGSKASGKGARHLTRAQKLKRALKSCRKHHRHAKKKRKRCERQARKRYAKHKASTKKAKSKHKKKGSKHKKKGSKR
jgi:NHL repeat/WD40-like Beta Propeller Repeat